MKKSYFGGLVLLVATFFAASAQAGMITDLENEGSLVKVNKRNPLSYTHDLNDEGFVWGTADSAHLSIEIYDDRDKWLESPKFYLEGVLSGRDAVLDKYDWGFIGTGDISGLDAFASLDSDGLLDVTVASAFGDFFVGLSTLTVYTKDPVAAVPEPSTLALLGLGLAGLGVCRRKAKA